MVRLSTQVSAKFSSHFVSHSFIHISTPNVSIFMAISLFHIYFCAVLAGKA